MYTIFVGNEIKISRSSIQWMRGTPYSEGYYKKVDGPRETLSGFCIGTYASGDDLMILLEGKGPMRIGNSARDWRIDEGGVR